MKIKRPESHCRGCVWLTRDKLCSFVRCVKWQGFKADKGRGSHEEEGSQSDIKGLPLDDKQHQNYEGIS